MVRVSSPAKLRPWSELTAKMVMGVVPGLAIGPLQFWYRNQDDVEGELLPPFSLSMRPMQAQKNLHRSLLCA